MKLIYVQPILASYRQELVSRLTTTYNLTVLCGVPTNDSGFQSLVPKGATIINCPHKSLIGGRILIQKGVLEVIRNQKPDVVLTCANIRDITYWQLLFLCRKLGIKVFSHGQGLYSKRYVNPLIGFLYRSAIRLSYKYICYTSVSRDSLVAAGCSPNKLAVADNAIRFSVDAGNNPKRGDEQGVLFVGRLREQCGLEDLVAAVADLHVRNPQIILHVVGSGELEAKYRNLYTQPWVVFHGAVYDEAQILELSRGCRVGCYPGNAGLSVVHYFSLRLPPVVHDDICSHMGPEPSYVKDGINGILFSKSLKSPTLTEALERVWQMSLAEYRQISAAAFSEYERLNAPSMATKMINILNSQQSQEKSL